MKIAEIRELATNELAARRNIARMKTVLRQRELNK